MTTSTPTSIPTFFQPQTVSQVYRVPYQERANQARAWAKRYKIQPAHDDRIRICLLLIDVQNTFCLPEFELFVGGRSGSAAIEDNQRLCQFIYKHLSLITTIAPTLDTHTAAQIFHPLFWVDAAGNPPAPMTLISHEAVVAGTWQINSAIAPHLSVSDLHQFAMYYTQRLGQDGKYPLTIWPYHSMLGGIGHALVAAVEEACFFHGVARYSPTHYEIKGNNPLTENYSVLSPEVLDNGQGIAIAQRNTAFTDFLLTFDAIIVAGQAKSHCVAWSVDDLLTEINQRDPKLAHKVYLLDDCTSPVVVPDVIDFTEMAEEAFQRFAAAGMHRVNTTMSLHDWPGLQLS